VAVGCTPLTATSAPTGGDLDGGLEDAGRQDEHNGPPGDAGSCQPGDVATYQPVYHPAGVADACTMGQIQGFFDVCFGAQRSSALCQAFQADVDAGNCASCILTPDSAPTYGPLVDHGTFVTANVAGCIELAVETGASDATAPDAGASDLACAKAVQADEGCHLAACEANCDVTNSSTLSAYEGCATEADMGGCGTYAAAASCVEPDAQALLPPACLVQDFRSFYFAVAPAFCMVVAVDAGAPVADADTDAGAMAGD
jgi:hypothetical protein